MRTLRDIARLNHLCLETKLIIRSSCLHKETVIYIHARFHHLALRFHLFPAHKNSATSSKDLPYCARSRTTSDRESSQGNRKAERNLRLSQQANVNARTSHAATSFLLPNGYSTYQLMWSTDAINNFLLPNGYSTYQLMWSTDVINNFLLPNGYSHTIRA